MPGRLPSRHARLALPLAILCLALPAPPARALDNPDAPDYVAEFESRAAPYLTRIDQDGDRTSDISADYGAYERFLDHELNTAYAKLMAKLDAGAKESLRQSQRAWLTWRDREFHFIAENWTPQNFGSSYTLSAGGYRTTLIKDRVVLLLNYLRNYA